MSMSRVRLLPNQSCQEEMEHPGPLCTAWEALRKFGKLDAESNTLTHAWLYREQVLWVWKRGECARGRCSETPIDRISVSVTTGPQKDPLSLEIKG